MKTVVFAMMFAIASWSVNFYGPHCLRAAAPDPVSPAIEPFEQALSVDATGDRNDYQRLLGDALSLDPEFTMARWYSGQVWFQGEWLPVEAVGQRVANDATYRQYHYRCQESGETAQAHAMLAKWCRRENLQTEERWHWQRVLQLDPGNNAARNGLGLVSYRGGWYTQQQIRELEQRTETQESKTEHYQRELRRWINQGRRGSKTLRAEMLSRIEAIDDPWAVDALGTAMNEVLDFRSSKHRAYHQEVCRAILTAFGSIPDHSSTLSLLNIVVFAADEELRKEAAHKLSGRDETNYMPLLLANLSAPIETSFQINVTPAGHVSVVQEFEEEHPQRVSRETVAQDLSSHEIIDRRGGRGVPGRPLVEERSDPVGDYRRAKALVNQKLLQVHKTNEQRAATNQRIVDALELVTGKQLGNVPSAWWKSWELHNELGYYDEKPVEDEYYLTDFRPFDYRWQPRRTVSCFVAGTPVWTQAGPKPIEQVRIGDFVLSQDPKSGRLAYRPVIDTTVRPPSALRRLTINNETITTTLGHRFWVAGEGWQMAKFLDVGNQLFSTRGSLELHDLEEVEHDEAYNLVVDEFHTYFVGQSRLLVHDNNCPQPTVNALPGVSKKSWQRATRLVQAQ